MCIFCKIVSGEVPCRTVHEDSRTLVFMDIAGDVDGHMLAIPKTHAETISDCGSDDLVQLMLAVKKVSDHCIRDCGYDGVNLLNANGTAAGQSVPHFHVHIIPRKNGDGIDAWPDFHGTMTPIDEIWNKIKM